MNPILSLSMWVSLPNEVRNRIRSIFSMPRSGNVVVNDGRIETDGTTSQDFGHLTSEKMREYVGGDLTDFHRLFDMVVARVNDDLIGKKEDSIVVSSDAGVNIILDVPKKKGRPAKK